MSENIESEYYLKDFQKDDYVPHPTVLFVGKRFSGKTTSMVSFANLYNVNRWAAWCGTKDTRDFWAERFDSKASTWLADEIGKAALQRCISYQEAKVQYYKKQNKPFPEKYTIGLIFDDVTSKRTFRRGEMLEDLFSNGRHYKAVIIISCQYIKQLPPAVRTNADYMFMLHSSKRTCKILWEEYVENPDDFSMFLELLRKVTGQKNDRGKKIFNSLVYNGCADSYRLDEIFQVYRHPDHFNVNEIKLGSEEWRNYNKHHFVDVQEQLAQKEQRKKEKLKRIRLYQEKNGKVPPFGSDLDIGDLSDTESSESQDSLHNFSIKNKKGNKIQMKMNKTRIENQMNQENQSFTQTMI